ncbi:MAG: regulatory protein RecX [Oscillospiraceae bacterium]|nr:regulatory protein RecX [Oscillospiraceae bacterium]
MFKIEKVSQFKGKTLQIDFDGREPIFIHADIVFDYHISAGVVMSENAIEEVIRANDARRAKERALYLLDERDYSYVELFKKLEKNYDEDICFEVLNRLVELGCINDRRYSKKLAEHLCVTKKYGYYRAREEMRARGLPNELIDEALAEFEDDTHERLMLLIEKKYARYLCDEKGVNKVKSALVRLGYSYSQVNSAIAEFCEE